MITDRSSSAVAARRSWTPRLSIGLMVPSSHSAPGGTLHPVPGRHSPRRGAAGPAYGTDGVPKLQTACGGATSVRLWSSACKFRSIYLDLMGWEAGSVVPLVLIMLGVGQNAEQALHARSA